MFLVEMTAKRRRLTQIERHPNRVSIEMARAAGVTFERIAATFKVDRDAVWRHWHGLDHDYRASLVTDVPREQLLQRAIEEGGTLLDGFKLVWSLVQQQLVIAKACGDSFAVATLAKASVMAGREVGRLTGEITQLASPAVTINNNNTINLTERPEFRALESGLVDIARIHPEAKSDIVALLRRVQAIDATPPMIEGERAHVDA